MLRQVSVSVLAVFTLGSSSAIAQVTPTKPFVPPAVTTLLPASIPGVVLVNTTPKAWAELERFNPFPLGFLSQMGVISPMTMLGFGEEIQSWLGDWAAIALLPADAQDKTVEANVLLLLPVKDGDRFKASLNKLRTMLGQPQIERDYKGVTLLRWVAPKPPDSPTAPDTTAPDTEETILTPLSHSELKTLLPLPSQVHYLPKPRVSSRVSTISLTRQQWAVKTVNPNSSKTSPNPEDQAPPLTPIPPESPLEEPTRRGISIALLPNAVAVAAQDRALEKLIDARSSEQTSLAQSPLFQRTLRHPQFGRSLIVGYGNIASFTQYLAALFSNGLGIPYPVPIAPIEDSQMALLTNVYNTVDTHLWVQPEGLHGQTNFYYTTPRPERVTLTSPDANQILTRLPAITYLSANSRNFKHQWKSFIESAFASPTSQPFFSKIRDEFRNTTGFDLENDVINWMDGEYAFFMFPTTAGFFNALSPRLNLGIGLIIQTSDRAAAEAFLKKLDQSVRKAAQGELAIVPRRVKGRSVISWEGKDRNRTISILSHGWLSNDTLVVTTGADAMSVLAPKPYLPLHLNPTFRTATASFPIPNEGYFYINMGASLSLLYGLVLPYIPREYSPFVQEFQRILGTVRSVSSSNSATAEAQSIDSLWVLGPAKR